MKNISNSQKYLIAEFLSNIAVAWFAAGVIGAFIGEIKNLMEIVFSVAWGICLSIIFMLSGFNVLKGVKK